MSPSSTRTSSRGGEAEAFRIDVGALRRHHGERREISRRGVIADLFVTASRVPEGAEVALEGVLESSSGGILVTATVTATWEGECRRCLEAASGQLRAEIVELVTDEPDPDTGYAVEGDVLDVRAMAHDACILELPPAPLCREECRGLCPICGVNRNNEECSCTHALDPRWAALAGLAGGEQQVREDRRN